MFGGWLADQVGGKWLFGGGVLACAALTLLTPTAAYVDLAAVLCVRVLEGAFEGFMMPTTHALLSSWTPRGHSTRSVTLVLSGEQLGYIVGMLVGGLLSDYG